MATELTEKEKEALEGIITRLYPAEQHVVDEVFSDDYVPLLRHILESRPEPGDIPVRVKLTTVAGTCIDIPTTCRLPEEFEYWNGGVKEYWGYTLLDGRRISAVNLLESLQNAEPVEDPLILDSVLWALKWPDPKEIKRTSMQLYAYVVPCANAWRMFYKLKLRKQMGNSGKYRAMANLLAPIMIIAVFMLMMGMEALS